MTQAHENLLFFQSDNKHLCKAPPGRTMKKYCCSALKHTCANLLSATPSATSTDSAPKSDLSPHLRELKNTHKPTYH